MQSICVHPHLLGALPLHLGGARCWRPKHAGSDADGQVEGVHLVVVGIALDTLQHSDHMSQQKQVLAGQEVEQPEMRPQNTSSNTLSLVLVLTVCENSSFISPSLCN